MHYELAPCTMNYEFDNYYEHQTSLFIDLLTNSIDVVQKVSPPISWFIKIVDIFRLFGAKTDRYEQIPASSNERLCNRVKNNVGFTDLFIENREALFQFYGCCFTSQQCHQMINGFNLCSATAAAHSYWVSWKQTFLTLSSSLELLLLRPFRTSISLTRNTTQNEAFQQKMLMIWCVCLHVLLLRTDPSLLCKWRPFIIKQTPVHHTVMRSTQLPHYWNSNDLY